MKQHDQLKATLRWLFMDPASPLADAVATLKEGASFSFQAPDFLEVVARRGDRIVFVPEGRRHPHVDFDFAEAQDALALRDVQTDAGLGHRIMKLAAEGRLRITTVRPFIESLEAGVGLFLQGIEILPPPEGYPQLVSSLKLKDIAFTEILDVGYLQELVDELARIIDVRLWVLDMDSIPQAVSSTGGEHCKLIINSLEGVMRCYDSAIMGIAELKKTLEPRVRICHAGFICFDAPLMLNGEMVGVITGDASLPSSPEPEVYRALAQELAVDPDALVASLAKVRHLNLAEIEFISSVVNAIGRVVTELSFKHYLLGGKLKELSILNRISSLLSARVTDDLSGVYEKVTQEVATLQDGVGCELEVQAQRERRRFVSGDGNGSEGLLTVDIREGKKRRGSISLNSKSGTEFLGSLRDSAFLESVGSQISMAMQNSALYTELKQKNEELRLLFQSSTEIQERERAAISRDLHDDTGQNLTNALLNMEMALSGSRVGSAKSRKHIQSAMVSISTVLEQLHDLTVQLHPPVLEDLGLTLAINNLARRMNAEYPIEFKMQVNGEEIPLPYDVKINLYRIVQEALTNVIKHSGADEALIHFSFNEAGIDLLVTDNGCAGGITSRNGNASLGLLNMRERSEQMGGSFAIHSGTTGTTVAVHVPADKVADSPADG